MKKGNVVKNVFLLFLMLAGFVSVFANGEQDAGDRSDAAVVNVWTWEPQKNQQSVIDDFYTTHPGIEVSFTAVPVDEIYQKLQATITSGSELPDVIWMERGQRGSLLALDIWEDLSNAPYNADTSKLLDCLEPVSYWKGKLVGFEVSPPMAGFAYRRDLALQYAGTDDPEELGALLNTWDKLIEFGRKMKAESNGKAFLFPGVDDAYFAMQTQSPEPFLIDGKSNMDKALRPVMERLVMMRREGLVNDILRDSAAWNQSFLEGNCMFYPCATWGPTWVFKANAPDTAGKWGLMVPPGGGFLYGGTIVAIPSKAKDKEAAYEYIRWTYFSEEGAVSNRDNLGYFSPHTPVYDDLNFYSEPDSFFGGQDILAFFAQNIRPEMAPSRAADPMDSQVSEVIEEAVAELNENPALTVSRIMEMVDDNLVRNSIINR